MDNTAVGSGKRVLLANPRGFCAGVDRAIEIVEQALAKHKAPIYVKHEVVHNKFVVQDFESRGVKFIEDIQSVPVGSTIVYSAHGVSQQVRRDAEERGLIIYDATCPLVSKVHAEVVRNRNRGREVVMIGHMGHPEVEGTMGQVREGIYLVESVDDVVKLSVKDPSNLAFVTQTTLSVDDAAAISNKLRELFPKIREPEKDDICYATQNRQDAVKKLADLTDVILVVGSSNSSNSNRLKEVGEKCGKKGFLIDSSSELREEWLRGVRTVGLTAGASAPESLVREVLKALESFGFCEVESLDGIEENVVFHIPKALSRSVG
ncbi:MAG: 4-hydroxy-3-methylbut-2-enyl diphosphate reductase [Burkholderiales bacterium]